MVQEHFGDDFFVQHEHEDVAVLPGKSGLDPLTLPPEYAQAEKELEDAQRILNEKRKLVKQQRAGALADRQRYVAEQIEYERSRLPGLEAEVAEAKRVVEAQAQEAASMAEETIMLRYVCMHLISIIPGHSVCILSFCDIL